MSILCQGELLSILKPRTRHVLWRACKFLARRLVATIRLSGLHPAKYTYNFDGHREDAGIVPTSRGSCFRWQGLRTSEEESVIRRIWGPLSRGRRKCKAYARGLQCHSPARVQPVFGIHRCIFGLNKRPNPDLLVHPLGVQTSGRA